MGRTGLEVSVYGFGAWAIGGQTYGHVSEKDAIEALYSYVENGGNFIDTASSYGESEKLIGKFLKDDGREGIIIASKSQNEGTKEDLKYVRKDLEESLRALNRDCIDVYYMHSPPADEDNMKRLIELYEQFKFEGKIGAIGASIKGVNVTDETLRICKQYIHTGAVDVFQLVYSIFRQKNAQIFKEAQEAGIGIVARTSLESGFLTGKYERGHEFAHTDHRSRWSKEKLDRILKEVKYLKGMTKAPYETVSQLSIRFSMQNEFVNSVIIGAKNKHQESDNSETCLLPNIDNQTYEDLLERYINFNDHCNTF